MKKLLLFVLLSFIGYQGFVFSQDNEQTQKMLEAKYSSVILDKDNNCFRVDLNGKKGICDLKGKEIISPNKYTSIYTFHVKDGFYGIKIDNKQGACDLTGKEIIPCKYDGVVFHSSYGSYYGVKLDGKEGACDSTGKEIIPCKYDRVVLHGSYYGVKLNGKEGACDLNGNEIVPCAYEGLIYSQGEFKYKNSSGSWVPIGDTAVLAEKNASSESNATISSTPSLTVTQEKPLYFMGKVYVLQSSDYSKIHMVSFYDVKEFLYMVFNGQTKLEIGRQYGEFTHSNGHIKIAFKDNSATEFDIKMINNNKVSFSFDGISTPAIYAVGESSDDLFSKNLNQFWGNYNSAQQSTYQSQQQSQQKVTQRVVCPSCNGTGKTCVLKTVPTYGTHSNVMHRCTNCNQLLGHGITHVQQRCARCQGMGYIER